MVKIYFNKLNNVEVNIENVKDILNYVAVTMNLNRCDFYLVQNGKRVNEILEGGYPVYVHLRVLGGKGGFGSMLRAIGAQIEKTTNREACRDLSGRRLRDINEEKRLKAWLDKQGEREREAEGRKKRKIEKLLAVPRHEFKDEGYEESRSRLTEKVCDAVEEGFKSAEASRSQLKRKHEYLSQLAVPIKKKKPALWLDDDISSNDDSDEGEDDEILKNEKNRIANNSIKITSNKETLFVIEK